MTYTLLFVTANIRVGAAGTGASTSISSISSVDAMPGLISHVLPRSRLTPIPTAVV